MGVRRRPERGRRTARTLIGAAWVARQALIQTLLVVATASSIAAQGEEPQQSASVAVQRVLDGMAHEPWAGLDAEGLPEREARLIRLVQGRHLWRFLGDADRELSARRAAIQESRALGVDAGPALSALFAHRWVRGWARRPGQATTGAGRGGDADVSTHGPLRVVRVDSQGGRAGGDSDPLDPKLAGSRRVATNEPYWWPNYQAAYLDLGYRWLPEQIESRLWADPVPPLRFWVVGYEDGSQVFLLGALIEDAHERVRRGLMKRSEALDPAEIEAALRRLEGLRVEIVATDLGLTPDRSGRVYRLAGFGPGARRVAPDGSDPKVPFHEVANLTLSEWGPDLARAARVEVERLEADLADGSPLSDGMRDALADAGKVGLLLERFFSAGIEVGYAGDSPRFDYHLHNDRWRIEDPVGVLNDGAPWSMRFSFADVTVAEAPAEIDGVLVTGVLPWLALYAEALDTSLPEHPVRSAWNRIRRSLRSRGWVLIDPKSERVLDPAWAKLGGASDEVLVTTASGIRPASTEAMRGESIAGSEPRREPTLLGTHCLAAANRDELAAARQACDDAAARGGSSAGFLRPCRESEQGERFCEACSGGGPERWLCFGVPHEPGAAAGG